MLVRYWRAALLAAAMVLSANAARAEAPPTQGGDCCKKKDCCTNGALSGCCGVRIIQVKDCCSGGSCCAGVCKNGQDGKAKECRKDAECCKGKCGACGCCCTAKTEPAKKTAFTHPIIIMVPVPMMTAPVSHVVMPPAIAAQPYNINVVPPAPIAPPMPPQSVTMPVPPPSVYACPPGGMACSAPAPTAMPSGSDVDLDTCLSVLGMVADVCFSHQQSASIPSMCLSALGMLSDLCGPSCPQPCYVNHPPQYVPPSPPFPQAAVLPPPRELPDGANPAMTTANGPPTLTCDLVCPAGTTACANKIRIRATPYDGQLEMSIGDDACMTCKKMTVQVGDCPLTMTTADGKVRVRAAELRAWADCVQTDRKERLILKGDVALHYKKDGRHADVTGEYIELNLATGAVTVKQTSPSAKPNRVGEAILYGSYVP